MVLPALGCTLQSYRPEPIEPARVAEALGSRRSDDADLRGFMERHNYAVSEWPLTQWDLEALTLMAVYFNPEMDVARANLAVQRAAEITAGQRPNPRANPILEHHSAASNGVVDTPWSVGLGLDFPIETGGKREARIARAQSLNDEARLSLGETAWKVRSRLRQRFVDAYAADETAKLAQQELDLRKQEVELLDRRQKAGEVSPSEVTLARLRLQETRLAADGADGNIRAARAALAAALGLPFEETEKLRLSFGKLTESPFPALPEPEVQHAALQNRLDLRQGLDRYAASEATLREEIARQYPDIDLSPGFLWDQGDWIKSLGGAILLPLLNNNEGPIGEAEANRKLEAARFKSLESDVLAQSSAARLRYETALKTWDTAKSIVATQKARLEDTKKLISFGESDRLTLVETEIELLAARRAELQTRIDGLQAWGGVEDAVQKPLDGTAPAPDDMTASPANQGTQP